MDSYIEHDSKMFFINEVFSIFSVYFFLGGGEITFLCYAHGILLD